MKCNHCGFENMQGAEYCVNCGAALSQPSAPVVEAISLNPAADAILPALKDKLFYVLCILMTVSCGVSLVMGGLSVINILLTVFLWLVYNDAIKGFANASHLQFISGTVYASYVVTNVLSVVMIVCGPLFAWFYNLAAKQEPSFYEKVIKAIEVNGIPKEQIPTEALQYMGYAIGGTLLIMGIIMLVFNILCMRKIHRFAKSVYMGIMYQDTNFYKPTTVKNWFIFLAVCNGTSALSVLPYGILAVVPSACSTAILIIVVMLINKYFPRYR